MGRKKSKRASIPAKKFKPKLDTVFSCPFCAHERAVECKLDRAKAVGVLNCRICSAGYQTVINNLSEPIDVYAEWVDAVASKDNK